MYTRTVLPFLVCLFLLPRFTTAQSAPRDTAEVNRVIDSLLQVSSTLTKQRQYDQALEVNAEAERLALAYLGRESVGYGKVCHSNGFIAYRKNDAANAEKWYLEAIEIRGKVVDKEHLDYASSLNNLAVLYYGMGHYEKSKPLFLEAKAIREKVLGKEHPDYARNLNDLAALYRNMGQYEKSEPLYFEAKAILEKVLGKEHPDYASNLNNLAILYYGMGQYEKSEPLFLEAKAIRKNVLGKEHPDYAMSLNNLAALYHTMGQYEKSEPLYFEAKAFLEKVLGKEHPAYASSLNNLANLYSDMGQYEKSEPLHLEAKAIREKTVGKEHPDYATSLNNLANLYSDMGQYEKSVPLHLEAKAIREKAFGKEHPEYGQSLNNLANLYRKVGNYEKSEPLYLKAKAIREKALGKEHPDYAQSLKNLSILFELQSRYPSSDTLLAEFHPLQQSRQSKAITFLSERDLSAYAATFQSDGDELASFTSNRLAKGRSATILPALYYNHQLFQKGFLLGAASRVGALAAAAPESEETFLRLKGFRRRLAAEYAKPIAERKNVPELEARADSLEKVLVRTVAGFGEALRQVNWQEVQTQLRPGEAAVEFVHYRYYDQKARATDSTLYAALVLLPADTAPRFVPLCEARQIEAAVQKAGADELRFQNLYNALDRPASPLYPLVWQPLEAHLQGVQTVYYAPSGLLHRLHLGAIQPTKRETLSDRYRLVALGSTRQLVVPPSVSPAGNTAAVFGGIRYEMDSTKIAAVNLTYADSSGALADVFRGSGGFVYTDSTLRGGSWNYLPATEVEATNISGLLKKHGFQTDTRLGFAATEESVQYLGSGKSPSPKVLHIATHGFFFPDPKATGTGRQAMDNEPTFKISDNPLIRSGLLLAGAEHGWKTGKPLREGMEDGILTAYEISQMNLRNTELVVLSACETGLGDIQGNEGLYGLQRAFKVAGARYLLMSLWQVPDKATQGFMEVFYAHWLDKGMSIPDAFRAAQAVARAGNANPLYWAGFVLVE